VSGTGDVGVTAALGERIHVAQAVATWCGGLRYEPIAVVFDLDADRVVSF
jgi:hypothetical protein